MKTHKWKDGTSYSRGQEDRTPSTWNCETKSLSITVTRHSWFEKDDWILHCYKIGIERHKLSSKDLELAKAEALDIVRKTLARWVKELG
jgi:hypothetical protein